MALDWAHFTPWAVIGVVFGIGWGLAGFWPGPALVSFGSGQDKSAVFVAAMLVGMLVYTIAERTTPATGAA
jgi:uncharacterized membrane protein YedE/YeeE